MQLSETKRDRNYIDWQHEQFQKHIDNIQASVTEAKSIDDVDLVDHLLVLNEREINQKGADWKAFAPHDIPRTKNYILDLVDRYLQDLRHRR